MLFDLDGVLIEARPWHRQALNRALRDCSLPILTPEQEQDLEGLPTKVKLDRLRVPEGTRDQIMDLKQSYTLRFLHEQAVPLPNVIETLDRLKLEGKRIGICSNAVRATVYAAMWRTGIVKYIDLVLSNEEARKPKPDPAIYLMALSCMHIPASEVVVVEDHPKGVAAARAAGIRVVQVKDPSEVSYRRLLEEEALVEHFDPRCGSWPEV